MSGLGAYAKLLNDALEELDAKQPACRRGCRRCRADCDAGAEGDAVAKDGLIAAEHDGEKAPGERAEVDENRLRQNIAEAALDGIRNAQRSKELPSDIGDLVLAESLLMAMQMAVGPQTTATVLRYSFVMVSET